LADTDLRRFALTLHYDGSGFHGWQIQPDVRTVQGDVEAILERISGARRPVIGSGRTDTGVHATGQVAAVDLPPRWTAYRLRKALNSLLQDDIWIESVQEVRREFHPRYDAVARSYRYRVGCVPRAASPFHRRWCWALGQGRDSRSLDQETLNELAAILVGDHSFKAFAKAGQEERGDRCTVESATWHAWEDLGLEFRITANRYLHHMVRYLVGTQVEMGLGKRPVSELRELLRDPETALITSPPAPPEGLFLTRVDYPEAALQNPEPTQAT
jgi:tRNA pseudouridine38-40 synthase